jgi:hypothetical protein
MQFLSPWYIPALAAILTIPPLVIMYFLRLRRRETPVPTTYLWRKVIEDLQVNQPFQKLRKNLLLLLQLLVLAAAIFALARPIRKVAISQDNRGVLIDRSARGLGRPSSVALRGWFRGKLVKAEAEADWAMGGEAREAAGMVAKSNTTASNSARFLFIMVASPVLVWPVGDRRQACTCRAAGNTESTSRNSHYQFTEMAGLREWESAVGGEGKPCK